MEQINGKFLLILPKNRSLDEVKGVLVANTYTSSFKHLMIMADELERNQELFTFIVNLSLKAPCACCVEVVIPMTGNLLAIRRYMQDWFGKCNVQYGGKGHFIELVLETKENKSNTDGVVTYSQSVQASNYGFETDNATKGNLHGSHAIQIRLPKYQDCKSLIEVERQTRKCMEEATRLKMTSIGFPALGVGELGYPPAEVAEIMMKEIDGHFKHNERTSLCNVKIMLSNQDKRTKQAFYEENLSRIRKGQIIGDTVHKVIVLISAREQFIKEIQERLLKMIAEPLQLPVKPHKKIKHRNQHVEINRSLSLPLASEKEEKDTTPSHVAPKKEFFYPVRWKLKQETVRASPLPPGVLLKEINSFSGLRGQIHNQDGMLFEGTLQQKNNAESFLSDYLNNLVPGVNLENVISDYTAMQQSESADSKRRETNKVNRYDGARREDRINENEAMRQNETINSNGGARPKEYPMNNPSKVPQARVVDRCIFKGLQKLLGSNKLKDLCLISKKKDDDTYCLTEREDKTEEVTLQDLISSLHQEKMKIPEEQIDDVNKFVESYKTHESLNLFVNDDTLNLIIVGQDKNAIRAVMEKVEIRLINKKSTNSAVGPPGFSKGEDGTFCTANGKTKIIVKIYNITKLKVDVVVNAANGLMNHAGGVAAAIDQAAGYKLGEECKEALRKHGKIPVTEICKTKGGNIRCKRVYHAVGPMWSDYNEKESCLHDLCKTIIRCLLAADIDGFHSIAFPSISSAIFGVPKDSCAEMYTRAVHYADSLYPFINLKQIFFVDISNTMVDLIQKCFTTYTTTYVKPSGNEAIIMRDFINEICKKYGVKNIEIGDAGSNMQSMENNQGFSVQVAMTENPASQPKLIFELTSGISIHVYQASVTDTHTESITSMEDVAMSNYNTKSLYKWLIEKAGELYERERKELQKQKNSFKDGEVYTTSGGDLRYKHIFHLMTSITPKEEELQKLTDNLILEITNNPVTSVTIGTSSIKMELELLFEIILKKVSELTSCCLKEIHLVDTSPDMMDKFQTCYKQVIKQAGGVIGHEEPMEANGTKEIVTKEAITKEIVACNECCICLGAFTNKTKLACGHYFCRDCITEALKSNNNCPICRKPVGSGVVKGTQPDGSMAVTKYIFRSLPGYKGSGIIEIHYNFPDGIQTEEHPNPGKRYKGTRRTAYLPDNTEGREVLSLLRIAFDRHLIFTIGQSVTTGNDNVVTWNDIHHKTSIYGGSTHFGYPDPDYLTRIKEELKAHGVVAESTITTV